jgi:hypothetical protein
MVFHYIAYGCEGVRGESLLKALDIGVIDSIQCILIVAMTKAY